MCRRGVLVILGCFLIGSEHAQAGPPRGQEKGDEADTHLPLLSSEDYAQISLPHSVPVEHAGRSVRLDYVVHQGQVFLFPPFSVLSANLANENGNTPLFGANGRPSIKPDSKGEIEIEIADWLAKQVYVDAIRQEFGKLEKIKAHGGKLEIRSPSMKANYQVRLIAKVLNNFELIGECSLLRSDQLVFVSEFPLTPKAIAVLGRVKRMSDLWVEISCAYKARFTKEQVEGTLHLVSQQLGQARNAVRSTPDLQPDIVVPLGGEGASSTILEQYLDRKVLLEVNFTGGADRNLAREVLGQLLAQAKQEINLSRENAKAVVSVLLGGQMKLTGTLGKIVEFSELTKTDRERNIEDALKHRNEESETAKVGGGLELNIPGAPVGGGLNLSDETQKKKSSEIEVAKKEVDRGFDLVSRAFKGEVPTVVGLRFNQDGSIKGLDQATKRVAFNETRKGLAEYSARLNLGGLSEERKKPDPPAPPALFGLSPRLAKKTIIDISQSVTTKDAETSKTTALVFQDTIDDVDQQGMPLAITRQMSDWSIKYAGSPQKYTHKESKSAFRLSTDPASPRMSAFKSGGEAGYGDIRLHFEWLRVSCLLPSHSLKVGDKWTVNEKELLLRESALSKAATMHSDTIHPLTVSANGELKATDGETATAVVLHDLTGKVDVSDTAVTRTTYTILIDVKQQRILSVKSEMKQRQTVTDRKKQQKAEEFTEESEIKFSYR